MSDISRVTVVQKRESNMTTDDQISTAREYQRLLDLEFKIESVDMDNEFLSKHEIESMQTIVRSAINKCRERLGIK